MNGFHSSYTHLGELFKNLFVHDIVNVLICEFVNVLKDLSDLSDLLDLSDLSDC